MAARTWSSIAGVLLAALPGLQTGCSQVVCGDGTIETDGVCLPTMVPPGLHDCGEGTRLGENNQCVVAEPTFCDDVTTVEEIDPISHVTTCVGIGGDVCTRELECPAPMANRLTLCGRIYDTESNQVIRDVGATGAICNPAAPASDGPCSLKIAFYDALLFQGDPTGTPALAGSITVDDCGRYTAQNLPMTSFAFIGGAIDDATGVPDTHILTGVATSDALAQPARNFRMYATRKTTEAAWSTAGNPGGGGYGAQGVIAMVYSHKGTPRAGVVARRQSPPIGNDDFYFSDPGPTRSTVDLSKTMTGANGTALIIHSSSPVPHDGVGGEPAGCRWPSALSATIPGVVFVQIKEAEANGGGPCQAP